MIKLTGKNVTYKGCVLSTFEQNGYNDSDFYAEVWDNETKSIKTILYDTTRCGGYGSATIDATLEVIRLAKIYNINNSYKHFAKSLQFKVRKNAVVTVIKGRKVKIGTIAKIVEIRDNVYDEFNKKVLLLLNDNTNVWTYENNLQVHKLNINERINTKYSAFLNNDLI